MCASVVSGASPPPSPLSPSVTEPLPPSFPVAASDGGCKSAASVVALGPKTPHAREIRDIHSAAKVASPLLPDSFSVVRVRSFVRERIHVGRSALSLHHFASSADVKR